MEQNRRFVRTEAGTDIVDADFTVSSPNGDWTGLTFTSLPRFYEIEGDPLAIGGRLNGKIRNADGTFSDPAPE